MNQERARTWAVGLGLLLLGTLGAWALGREAADLLLLPATLTRESRPEVPDLVGEELEGARRSPVRVVVSASPPALLEGRRVEWAGHSVAGALSVHAGAPGAGMLLVEVTADVRQGPRRRLRRVNRFRYPFEVR